MRRVRLLGLLLAGVLAGCGVPVQSQPSTTGPAPGPVPTAPATADSTTSPSAGQPQMVLYFLAQNGLVATQHATSQPGSARHLIALLTTGPSASEARAGLTTAVTPGFVDRVWVQGGIAEVDLGAGQASSGRSDEVNAFGQLVLSLTSLPQVSGVVFRRNGQVTAVPRGDGSLTDRPVTAADYRTLLVSASPTPARSPTP